MDLNVNTFIMKKSSLHNADELKDLSVQLCHSGIINRGTLFLATGIPQSLDEFMVEYRLCTPNNQEGNSLTVSCESEHFTNMSTRTTMSVLELKEMLREELRKSKGIEVKSAKCIRLRERFAEYKNILRDGKLLRDYQLYDKKVIGITVLEEEEDLKNDELLLGVKYWDYNTKELQ